jgi:hypothetical protein
MFSPENGSDRSIDVGKYLGCAIPRRSGGLVLSLRQRLCDN